MVNCGDVVYDLRTLDNRPKSRPPLIETMSKDARTTVVLGCSKGVALNGVWMRMEMMGTGDIIRMRKKCEGIVTENYADSDARGDLIGQIHETFLNNEISEVCVKRPDVLDHYVVMELDGMEPLKTIFEGMDSKDTVIMISTRTPYDRWGLTFQFHPCQQIPDQLEEIRGGRGPKWTRWNRPGWDIGMSTPSGTSRPSSRAPSINAQGTCTRILSSQTWRVNRLG